MKSLNISQKNPDCYIMFVKVQMCKGKKLAIITHDLNIYKCAFNSQHLTPTGSSKQYFASRYIVFCCPTWHWQNNCWKWHWHMCHWKWYLNFCSSSWKLWWQYIYMRGIEYIITTNLAIMIVSLMSLYMWYTKEDSLWMKTKHGCILWRCPVWHSGDLNGNKNDLTFYVCSGLLEYCSSKGTCKLVVVGDTKIMGQDWKSNIHMKYPDSSSSYVLSWFLYPKNPQLDIKNMFLWCLWARKYHFEYNGGHFEFVTHRCYPNNMHECQPYFFNAEMSKVSIKNGWQLLLRKFSGFGIYSTNHVCLHRFSRLRFFVCV